MNLLLFLVLLTIPFVSANWKDLLKPKPINGLSGQCKNDTNTWMRSLEIFVTVSLECLLTQKCTVVELKILEENLYAVQQLDAFGQFPGSGLMELKTLYDGSYQECERIKKYETNYCYMPIRPGKKVTCSTSSNNTSLLSYLPLRIATCLPNSCGRQEMVSIFNQITPYPFTACAAYCVKNEVKKDSAFWGYTIFLIIVAAIAILASLVDYIRETVFGVSSSNEEHSLLKVLYTFSLWTNAELILSVKEQKVGFIKSLDSIRFLTISWVLTGHAFLYYVLSDTLEPIIQFREHFWNHLLLNAFVAVDTFFVLSGLVVAYLFKPDKKMVSNPLTLILFYVHRYLRLTPPIMLFIGFFTVYAPHIQGPFSASELNEILPQAEACKNNWWPNLLYINNFATSTASGSDTCYGITWYLATDTQLYLVAPIILVAFWFSFGAGTAVIAAGCVGSITATYILYDQYNLAADSWGNGNTADMNRLTYTRPWIRCTPYLLGMFTGYLLARFGTRRIRLNPILAVAGWIIAIGIAFACLFSTYDYDKGTKWTAFERGTFYNFDRLLWGVFICWVVAANHMGWGGPINNFMSHPMWQPFGRLSYCAYIVHWMVLYWYLNIGGTLHYSSAWGVFLYTAIPAILLTYILAFLWSCLFEIPILKLEKMLVEVLMGASGRTSLKVKDSDKEETKKKSLGWDIQDDVEKL